MSRSSSQSHKATVFIAASELDSNLYYATRFIAPDAFIYLEIKGERILVMNDLELDRAKSQAAVDRVLSYSEIAPGLRVESIGQISTTDEQEPSMETSRP